MSTYAFHQNNDAGRFELRDGETVAGFMQYKRVDPSTVDVIRTVVEEPYQGQGLAMELLMNVVEWARAHDQSIIPTCPYVRKKLLKHPELADVARGLES